MLSFCCRLSHEVMRGEIADSVALAVWRCCAHTWMQGLESSFEFMYEGGGSGFGRVWQGSI